MSDESSHVELDKNELLEQRLQRLEAAVIRESDMRVAAEEALMAKIDSIYSKIYD